MLKSFIRFFVFLAGFVGLAACGDDEPAPNPAEENACTVLVYLAADNSLASFATKDYAEMLTGMGKVGEKGMRLLVYMDTGDAPKLIELRNEDGKVKEQIVKSYDERNSVGVSETKQVFNDVFGSSAYQAGRYGLVYWSHGDGWAPYPLGAATRWIGQDKSSGDKRMNISEFKEILQAAPHFDFILLDACFVASVEVAYALREHADYFIGSPTETPGPGAPYDEIVPRMFSSSDAAVNIGTSYFDAYNIKYTGGSGLTNDNWTAGVSMCVIRTSALTGLASATKQALQGAKDIDAGELCRQVFNYDKRTSSTKVGYYDMAAIMELLLDADAYGAWRPAFDAAVAYWGTTPQNFSQYAGMFSLAGTSGMTHYIPAHTEGTSALDAAYRSTPWYEAAGLSALGW